MSKMVVPFLDLSAQYQEIKEEVNSAIKDVIGEKAFIGGRYVKEFEENFVEYCGARYCVGVGNGTDALFISLKSLEIGAGDEVIVPANTFIATSEAVTLTGATPVFVDCDAQTYNIDTRLIENKITDKTKAIIPVHLYGRPADMETVCQIAAEYQLKIVQDCAQAHGAAYKNRVLADFGDCLCFSFYPGKNLGAYGDAGGIVMNDESFAKKVRMFANHGRMSKYDHEFEGDNSRMDGIQGAILNVKLKYLEDWTEQRRKNAAIYDEVLSEQESIVIPQCVSDVKHVYHLYVVRVEKRDELRNFLAEKGISTGIHYPIALPNLLAYQYLGNDPADFPTSSRYQNEILSLPMYPELDKDRMDYVAENLRRFYQ